ncbi:MAG: hypothetical protein GXY83_34430 [Rhodopirellula sp.]|nr:hypothetical protein [Rhodopirellula sp.]
MPYAVDRRTFLGTTGSLLLAGGVAASPLCAAEEAGWPELPPVKVHVVYLGLGGAWPKPDFDAPKEIEEKFAPYLSELENRLGDVRFVGGELIPNRVEATRDLLPKIAQSQADAILVIHLAVGNAQPFKMLAETGKPVAIYSQPFSGHDWMYVPRLQRDGFRLILAPSRDMAEIDRLAALLRVPQRMKQSKIIAWRRRKWPDRHPRDCRSAFAATGTTTGEPRWKSS